MVERSSSENRRSRHARLSEQSSSCQTDDQPQCAAEDVSLPSCSAGQHRGAKRRRRDRSSESASGSSVEHSSHCQRIKRKLDLASSSVKRVFHCGNISDLLSQSSVSGIQGSKIKSKCKHQHHSKQNKPEALKFSAQKHDFNIQQSVTKESDVLQSSVSHSQQHKIELSHQQDFRQSTTKLLQSAVGGTESSTQYRDLGIRECVTGDSQQRSITDVLLSTISPLQPHNLKLVNRQAVRRRKKKSSSDSSQSSAHKHDLQIQQNVAEDSQQRNVCDVLQSTLSRIKHHKIKLVIRGSLTQSDPKIQHSVTEDSQQRSIFDVLQSTISGIQPHKFKLIVRGDVRRNARNGELRPSSDCTESSAQKHNLGIQEIITEDSQQRNNSDVLQFSVAHTQPHKIKLPQQQDLGQSAKNLCNDCSQSPTHKYDPSIVESVIEDSQQRNISDALQSQPHKMKCVHQQDFGRSATKPCNDCSQSSVYKHELSIGERVKKYPRQINRYDALHSTISHSQSHKTAFMHQLGLRCSATKPFSDYSQASSALKHDRFGSNVAEDSQHGVNSVVQLSEQKCDRSTESNVTTERLNEETRVVRPDVELHEQKCDGSTESNVTTDRLNEETRVVRPDMELHEQKCDGSTESNVTTEILNEETCVVRPDVELQSSSTCSKEAPKTKLNRWGQVPVLKNLNTVLSSKLIQQQLASTSDIVMDLKRIAASKSEFKRLQLALKWPYQPGRNFSGPLLKRFQQNMAICRNCEGNPYVPSISTDASKLNLSRKNCATTFDTSYSITKCLIHNLPIECLALKDKCLHKIVFD